MTLDRRRAVPLWLLGVLTFSGPVGMHIFVPALPAAAKGNAGAAPPPETTLSRIGSSAPAELSELRNSPAQSEFFRQWRGAHTGAR